MRSVINYIECPNCKHEAFEDFYYKTGEEYIFCDNCGYYRSATIINRDKKLSELTDDDWKLVEIKNPYGAYRLKFYKGSECGILITEEDYFDFKHIHQIHKDVEFCTVSRFINNEIVKEIIVDNGPKIDSAGFTEDDREEEYDKHNDEIIDDILINSDGFPGIEY